MQRAYSRPFDEKLKLALSGHLPPPDVKLLWVAVEGEKRDDHREETAERGIVLNLIAGGE